MKLNRLIRSVLKSAVYLMDQTADQIDRVSDRASDFADTARGVVYPDDAHVLRNVLSFAAGIGVGVAAGMLLAPSSGAELRNTISDKVQDISGKVRSRVQNPPTGTEV
jgi:hypothetical protein